MNELIKVEEKDGRQVVSARELYERLGFNITNWSKWYKKNIIDNEFAIENDDYVGFVLSTNGNETLDFALSIDFAKRISMMARTETGEQIRRYFIEVEKKAKETSVMSIEEVMIHSLQQMVEQKKRLANVEQDINLLKAGSQTSPDYFTIMGFASLNNAKVPLETASILGKKAAAICKTMGYAMGTIPDPRFGRVNTYPREVLETVFKECFK